MTLSVLLTAAGVLIAALGDFSFDLVGYSMAFISVFFQVRFHLRIIGITASCSFLRHLFELIPIYLQTMYLVLVEKSGAEDGLSSVEIMFYNSVLSIPFLLFLIVATGEFPNSLIMLFAKVYPTQ